MLKIIKKASNEKKFSNTSVNILVIGATGVGKSSTINALFNHTNIASKNLCEIGYESAPKTKESSSYNIGKVKIWDTPGLGDSKEKDDNYKNQIEVLLQKRDSNNEILIDLILVIIDGSNKDISTTIDLINKTLIPNLAKEDRNRILIGINKIDKIKSSRYWDFSKNKPTSQINEYLSNMQLDIKHRVFNVTNISIDPIIYSAGDSSLNIQPYNLLELIACILKNLPFEKRKTIVVNRNDTKNNWKNNEDNQETKKSLKEILRDIFRATLATSVGSIFGIPFIEL